MNNEKQLIDSVLKLFWTPKSTPLWKHHLPSILIGTVLLALCIFIGLQPVEFLIPVFVVLLLSQLAFGVWARVRFGDKNPKESK